MDPTRYPGTYWAICTFRTSQAPAAPAPSLTDAERGSLAPLQRRYEQGGDCFGDLFDERELAHLRFLCWLYWKGRLTS